MSEIIRVEEDGVEFFTVATTGESGMSYSGLAKLCGIDKTTISRLIDNLLQGESIKYLGFWSNREIILSLTTTKKGGKLKILKKEFALDVVKYFYAKGFCALQGCSLIGMPVLKLRTNSRKILEHVYRDRLAECLGGETEVPTLAGNIDVLTPTELIEVKRVIEWKDAVGQILVYAKYFPERVKRIHLFGEAAESYLDLVRIHASEFDIEITWEL